MICSSTPLCFPGCSAGKEFPCNAGNPSLIPGLKRCPGEGIPDSFQYSWASLVAQTVKNSPAMWEIWVRSQGWEDSPGGGHGNPLQVSCLENHHGQSCLEVYSPWTFKISDITDGLSTSQHSSSIILTIVTHRLKTTTSFFNFCLLKKKYWSIVDLQCC